MSDIRVASQELSRFIVDLFHALGMSRDDAAVAAEVLVWANLRGVDTHGAMRLPTYVDFIRKGTLDPAARPVVQPLLDATFKVDSRRSAGAVAMKLAIDRATELAAKAGVGLGLVSDTTHTGAIGYYAQKIAERGCAALVIAAGPPFMAYHGGRAASLATSPVAMGIPAGDGEPLLLDMATSLISNGRLRQAAAEGTRLPEGAAIDADGRPTTDGTKAKTLLPLGGAKGSGLSLLFECLTGVLAATPILTALAGLTGRPAAMQNVTVIAINIATFRPLADFRHDVGQLQGWVKTLPRQQGVEELLLPGERGGREAVSRQRSGIPLSAKLWGELCSLGETFGVSGLAQRR
jgi:ureidoglycolate dehydrogenase (NAD+)